MPLTILSYVIVSVAAFFWGRRLYGSWVPALVLAIMSPLPFLFLAPLIDLALFFLLARVWSLFGAPSVDLDNEWVQGACTLFSALVCALALRHFAKTEGVEKSEATSSDQDPRGT